MPSADAQNRSIPEAHLINRVAKALRNYVLIEKAVDLPNDRTADLHLKDQEGNDLFVEVKSNVRKRDLGNIIDLNSAIQNSGPQLKSPRLLLVANEIDSETKRKLKDFSIEAKTFSELRISIPEITARAKERRRLDLTPAEASIIGKWEKHKPLLVTVKRVQEELKCTRDYAKALLHRLKKKRWIERVSKGRYIFIPSEYGYVERFPPLDTFAVGSQLVSPYYFSYSSANSHYGFSTQVSSVSYIATTKVIRTRVWRDTTFQFVTLSPRKFFGFKEIQSNGVKVKIAEPEKALVDSIDKPRYSGDIEEVVRIVYHGFPRIDPARLGEYALRMGSHSLCQRLGFIIDFLHANKLIQVNAVLREQLLENVGSNPICLAASRPKTGYYSRDWNLIVNVEHEQLMAEIRIR